MFPSAQRAGRRRRRRRRCCPRARHTLSLSQHRHAHHDRPAVSASSSPIYRCTFPPAPSFARLLSCQSARSLCDLGGMQTALVCAVCSLWLTARLLDHVLNASCIERCATGALGARQQSSFWFFFCATPLFPLHLLRFSQTQYAAAHDEHRFRMQSQTRHTLHQRTREAGHPRTTNTRDMACAQSVAAASHPAVARRPQRRLRSAAVDLTARPPRPRRHTVLACAASAGVVRLRIYTKPDCPLCDGLKVCCGLIAALWCIASIPIHGCLAPVSSRRAAASPSPKAPPRPPRPNQQKIRTRCRR